MASNLFVDVSAINATISKVNQLMNEGQQKKYYILQEGKGSWASPLHLSSSMKDFKIEAVTLHKSMGTWSNWGSQTISTEYKFSNDFTMVPVITATYDGGTDGVTVRIDVNENRLRIFLSQPKGSKWPAKAAAPTFNVHFIAVGS